MMIIKTEIIDWIKSKTDSALFRHSIATQEMAVRLAGIYNVDHQKAMMAGLLHDCAKSLSRKELLYYAERFDIPLDEIRIAQPGLLHAPVGAKLVEVELGITDDEILHAIAVHNTGSRDMSGLDKILYLADATEANRDYPGVEHIRDISLKGDLDMALLTTIEMKIRYVMERKALLHPMSVDTRNDVLKRIKCHNI